MPVLEEEVEIEDKDFDYDEDEDNLDSPYLDDEDNE